MDVRLDNKIALVTGGAGGFGSAYAQALARSGATVAVADLNEAGVQATAAQLRATGGRADGFVVDLRSQASVEQLVQAVVAAHGGLDILVNVAGTSNKVDLKDLSEDDWDRVIDANLKGIYLACKATIPHLVQRGGGRIINMGSNRGIQGQPHGSHYAASKGGVIALSRSLAQEVSQHRITVNTLAPGATDTAMWERGVTPAEAAARRASGELGRPEDFADLVVFLASDQAAMLTGMLFLRDVFIPR